MADTTVDTTADKSVGALAYPLPQISASEGSRYLADSRFIHGGYFVVATKNELSTYFTVATAPSVAEDGKVTYYADGTIVKGSLCYCQGDNTHYMYNGTSWVEASIGGGGVSGGVIVDDTEDEKPTENLCYTHIPSTDSYMVWGIKDTTDPTGNRTQDIYTDVVIPSTHKGEDGVVRLVTEIADYAFHECSKLETVKIPNSVTSIGNHAFYKCTSLKYVEIPDSVTDIGSNGGATFEFCSNLEWVSIPKSVKCLAVYTFNGCEKATLYCEPASRPEGWQENASDSWNQSGCPVVWNYYLEQIKSQASISVHGKQYTTSKGLFVRYNGADDTYAIMSRGVCTDTDIVIPSSYKGRRITLIASGAFMSEKDIKSVVIAEGVTSIYASAFQDCTSLIKIELPDSLTDLAGEGGKVFWGCSSLDYVFIPSLVETVGTNSFAYCDKLASIACGAMSQPEGWMRYWNAASDAEVSWGVASDVLTLAQNCVALASRCSELETRCSELETRCEALESNIETIVKVIYSISKREDFNDNILWPQLLKADNSTKYDWLKYVGYVTPAEDPNLDWGEYT